MARSAKHEPACRQAHAGGHPRSWCSPQAIGGCYARRRAGPCDRALGAARPSATSISLEDQGPSSSRPSRPAERLDASHRSPAATAADATARASGSHRRAAGGRNGHYQCGSRDQRPARSTSWSIPGATMVALTYEDAQRAGISCSRPRFHAGRHARPTAWRASLRSRSTASASATSPCAMCRRP